MLPHHKGKTLNCRKMLQAFRKIDESLEGTQRKIRIYCIGGTILVLENKRKSSKDIDFIVSQRYFITLSGHIAELEWKDRIQIDMFRDGYMPDYKYEEYF